MTSGIGGENIAENVEGRERYPINVRYAQDFRNSIDRMRSVLLATPTGAQIPLGQVATVSYVRGPAMIRDEDGALTGYVYIDLKSADYGGFVTEATKRLHDNVSLPAGLHLQVVRRVRVSIAGTAAAARDTAGCLSS